MRKLGDRVAVRGFPGADPTVDVIVPVEAQGSRVLCKRHNEALSPLDHRAGKMLERLLPATQYISKRRFGAALASRWVFMDGPRLEAWSAKVLAGTHAAGLNRRAGVKLDYSLNYSKVRAVIERGELEEGAGMYVLANIRPNEHGLQHTLHNNPALGAVVGIHINLAFFSFMFVLDAQRFDFDFISSQPHTYRPSVHRLYGPGGDAKLFFAWKRRPDFKQTSQGRVFWSPTGSSSAAPNFELLSGPPEIDDRTKR
ncbi:hypothetical protein [Bradyrhizobium cajani]|uniref:Uncharacterized protein n=1 Tax=Bradyrhizobium cajani TaxID=1928661 RepID=A0A844TJ08_9BRAD|nr:hypothetical protein [Bradyrhizobium cajani]MCP3369726.1 hypothetical protein [Bradyrhizobium cajani]MVT74971.1 hypothetical protein [Bradyrhizobium cajani]